MNLEKGNPMASSKRRVLTRALIGGAVALAAAGAVGLAHTASAAEPAPDLGFKTQDLGSQRFALSVVNEGGALPDNSAGTYEVELDWGTISRVTLLDGGLCRVDLQEPVIAETGGRFLCANGLEAGGQFGGIFNVQLATGTRSALIAFAVRAYDESLTEVISEDFGQIEIRASR